MKRHDMVKLIAEFIYELNVESDESLELASNLLFKLEDAGMRPPLWDNFNPSDSERYCSGDRDWTFQRTDPDGKRIWSLKCDSWEQE